MRSYRRQLVLVVVLVLSTAWLVATETRFVGAQQPSAGREQKRASGGGASYVAPLKPRRPEIPAPRPGLEHPIDRILDRYYQAQGVEATPPTDDVALVRRMTLDLVGQLPTASEVEAFVEDRREDKRAQFASRLLAEKRSYADHWISFWNDLLRNEYQGTGYIDGGRKQISAWLYTSLVDNKPYDRFVRELISPSPESEGFIGGIKWRGRVNASQVREVQFAQNVAQVFFGVNMKCASCHDSFIDSWKLEDAYGLAAIIADQPLELHRCDKGLGVHATPRFLFPELGDIAADQPKEKRLEQLAALVTHSDNGRFTRTIANRLWQRLMGRGIVHPVDMMANQPWSADLLDHLAVYLVDSQYDLKKLLEYIVTSRAYQSQCVAIAEELPGDAYVFRGPHFKRMTAEQFLDAIWQVTGTSPDKPAAPVPVADWTESTPHPRRRVRASLVHADLLMRSLGRPNREQVVTTRPDQLTTLQALDLANGQLLAEILASGAQKLSQVARQPAGDQPTASLLESIYIQALSRPPTAEEAATASEILGASPTHESIADLLWIVFMLPEFQLIR